ncbi:RING finger and transmembrane domain-containing protein 1 [Cercospora zeina]
MASNKHKIMPRPPRLPTHADFMIYLTRRGPQSDVRFQDSCPICLSEDGTPFRTACGHIFCEACSVQHFTEKETCPMCRRGLFDNATKLGLLRMRGDGNSLKIVERIYIKDIDCLATTMLGTMMMHPPGHLDFEAHRKAWHAGRLDLSPLQDTMPRTWVRVEDYTWAGLEMMGFRQILKCYYRDERAERSWPTLEWASSDENYPWPEYSNGLEKTRCFRRDLDCVLDFIVLVAVNSSGVREFTTEFAHVAIDIIRKSPKERVPFWKIGDLGSLELEEAADREFASIG